MFTLSIALIALATIFAMFGLLGAAGHTVLVGSAVLLFLAVSSMIAYWRRRGGAAQLEGRENPLIKDPPEPRARAADPPNLAASRIAHGR